ncbi:MAG: hypothetical protein ACOVRK_06375, partial [Chryseobacterium taeanense]
QNTNSLFEGEYITSWLENNKPYSSRLTIERIENTQTFNLFWTTLKNNKTIFRGKACLLNDFTIYGYYSGEPFIQEH